MKTALLVMLLAACPAPNRGGAPAMPGDRADASPGLVVLLIIDQFPEWSLERKRSELTRGFARVLREGEWRLGRHPSAATLTAPGHALLGTGASPAQSGIIANEWWSREHARKVKAGEDETGKTTSKWLRVPGLGDAVAAANTGAKAVAVSLKSRAARLPLGHAGLALYYDTASATFVANGGAAPWLAEHNRTHPIAPRLVPWRPSDPARLAQLSGVVDAQRGEVGEKGFGPAFPHDPKQTKNPHDALYAMPLGNDVVLETALAAIDGEQLGADRTIDLLIVSLSAHDYVMHGWGHESWEAWETALLLDAKLDEFLGELDRKVGKQRWALVLTSDHGGSPLPEVLNGGRYTDEQIKAALNQAASLELGPGEWIAYANLPNVYLSQAALAQKPAALEAAKKKIGFALKAFPGLAVAERTDAFAGRCDERKGDDRALCLSIDPERSGDFFYLPARGWIIEEESERLATGHGSLHDYDRDVPVVLLP
ncbi:MAG TPA: alkaline phosphatase family protein, partial [Kofleriaceae bacterium]